MSNEGIQIRLGDILHIFSKHKFMIIAFTVLGLMAGLVMSGVSFLRGDIRKDYLITSSVAVSSLTPDGKYSSSSTYPNNNDYHLAEDMVKAAAYVLQSEATINQVINDLGITGISSSDIKNNLSMSQYADTLILEEKLYWRSAEEGSAILEALNSAGTMVLQETMHIGGVNVINPPMASYMMGGSLNATMCIMLVVMGFMVAAGISVLEFLVTPTLLVTGDMERLYGVEILGEIPKDKDYFRRSGSLLIRNGNSSGIPEAFSSVSHIVRNVVDSKTKHQCIYFTSATRNEGKTLAVANLAIQLSDAEKKVLIMDLDFQNPTLGTMFLNKVEFNHSLNGIYSGDINEFDAITSLTGYLDILPTMSLRNSLVLDKNILELISSLLPKYDYILIDTAPVGLNSNVLKLNAISTGSIMVVRYDTASIREIRETVDKLEKSGAELLGCIINDVMPNRMVMSRATFDNMERIRSEQKENISRPDSILEIMTGDEEVMTDTGLTTKDDKEDSMADYRDYLDRTNSKQEEQEDSSINSESDKMEQ